MRGVAIRKPTLVAIAALMALVIAVVPAPAAPITATVPYSSVPVADADLDGDANTGSWSGSTSWTIPLENGAPSPYGSATLTAKHDGTFFYFMVKGSIDVAWVSSSGNHFWLGIVFTSSATSHHSTWQDGVFFGEDAYTSAPPLIAVDTRGGGQPPSKDGTQDDLGRMTATGSGAPYSFTAEWKRKLSTGDGNDLTFVADGATSYYFYATTDSNGGGSRGGSINHKVTTNDNVIRFAVPSGDTTPPTVAITNPANAATVSGTVLVTATASDDVGVASVTFLIDGTSVAVDTAAPYEYSWDTSAAANGAHTIRAEARDAANNVGSDQIDVTVNNLDSIPPVAVAGPDVSIPAGTLLTFDGSASSDNVGITEFVWTFTDGGPQTLSGATPQYRFSNVGDYLVTLTVTDAAGNTATDTLWVHVTADNAPPLANAGTDQAVLQGAFVYLNGTLSSDDVAVANYTWTFADSGGVTLYGAVVGRRFFNTGSFLITLTVRDFVEKTGLDIVWVNVTVDTTPPVAKTCGDHVIRLGDSVTLNGTNSTDNVVIMNYTWMVEGTATVFYGPVVVFTPTAGGIYPIVLTVFDASNRSSSDTSTVTVIAPDRTAPAAVRGIVAAASGPGSVMLTWSPNSESDLAGYVVYRVGPDGLSIRLNAVPIGDTTYTDQGLVPGQTYRYIVEAVDTSGNLSTPSNEVTGTAGLSPSEPFDWMSIRWALPPIAAASVLVLFASLAWREERRRRQLPPPPAHKSPSPPPEVEP